MSPIDRDLHRKLDKEPISAMTNESEPDPGGRPHCEHVCPEHRYTTTEIDQLVWSIYDQVRPLRTMLEEPNRRIDELPSLLANIGKCIKFGSPLLEPLPQMRLYRDPTTGAEVWTCDPPSYEAAVQPTSTPESAL